METPNYDQIQADVDRVRCAAEPALALVNAADDARTHMRAGLVALRDHAFRALHHFQRADLISQADDADREQVKVWEHYRPLAREAGVKVRAFLWQAHQAGMLSTEDIEPVRSLMEEWGELDAGGEG